MTNSVTDRGKTPNNAKSNTPLSNKDKNFLDQQLNNYSDICNGAVKVADIESKKHLKDYAASQDDYCKKKGESFDYTKFLDDFIRKFKESKQYINIRSPQGNDNQLLDNRSVEKLQEESINNVKEFFKGRKFTSFKDVMVAMIDEKYNDNNIFSLYNARLEVLMSMMTVGVGGKTRLDKIRDEKQKTLNSRVAQYDMYKNIINHNALLKIDDVNSYFLEKAKEPPNIAQKASDS